MIALVPRLSLAASFVVLDSGTDSKIQTAEEVVVRNHQSQNRWTVTVMAAADADAAAAVEVVVETGQKDLFAVEVAESHWLSVEGTVVVQKTSAAAAACRAGSLSRRVAGIEWLVEPLVSGSALSSRKSRSSRAPDLSRRPVWQAPMLL